LNFASATSAKKKSQLLSTDLHDGHMSDLQKGAGKKQQTTFTFVILVLVWMILHCFSPESILKCSHKASKKIG